MISRSVIRAWHDSQAHQRQHLLRADAAAVEGRDLGLDAAAGYLGQMAPPERFLIPDVLADIGQAADDLEAKRLLRCGLGCRHPGRQRGQDGQEHQPEPLPKR